eukprot:tig00000903_g5534.t1
MVEVYVDYVKRRYLAPRFSLAYAFDRLSIAFIIIITYIIAYSTHSFWVKEQAYREQPIVRFKAQYFVTLAGQDSAAGNELFELYLSDDAYVTSLLADHTRATEIRAQEDDPNNDGRVDAIQIYMRVPLRPTEAVRQIKGLFFFDFQLGDYAKLRMESAAYLAGDTALAPAQLRVTGELKLEQRGPFSLRQPPTLFNTPVMPVSNNTGAANLRLWDILANYTTRNTTTVLEPQYWTWVPRAAPGDFELFLTVRVPPQTVRYQPEVWEVLKFAWIQYAAVLLFVWYLTSVARDFVFRNQLLDTRVVTEAIKPHQF